MKRKSKLVAGMFGALMSVGILAPAAAAAVSNDHWDSSIDVTYTLKGRDMRDIDGDYRVFFDQWNTATSDCQGQNNVLVVTLKEAEGLWHSSQGSRNLPKTCARVDGVWWTNHGGDLMYYYFKNRDVGTARGELDSRDA